MRDFTIYRVENKTGKTVVVDKGLNTRAAVNQAVEQSKSNLRDPRRYTHSIYLNGQFDRIQ